MERVLEVLVKRKLWKKLIKGTLLKTYMYSKILQDKEDFHGISQGRWI